MPRTSETFGYTIARMHVIPMKMNVQRKFLHHTFMVIVSLLFEGEVLFLEEHVEYLVSEWVVVNRYCHE